MLDLTTFDTIETMLPGVIYAYVLGSIPFGLLLSKLMGYGDIRKIGSGNIGATNVLRTGNKPLALATLILDGGKGAAAVLLYKYALVPFYVSMLLESAPKTTTEDWYLQLSVIGFFAILGHCFPIWLKFKGGKGVATAIGTLLAAVPIAGAAACLTWLVAAFALRYSSLAALLAVAVAPIVTFFFYGAMPAAIIAAIAVLVWYRHKENIKRLIARTEPKIGNKNKG